MQWVKLLCEIEFYNIVIFIILFVAGIQTFSVKAVIKCIIPFYTLGTEFISSYLVFFWFIPFINLLLKQLDKNNHLRLILLCFISDSVFQTVIRVPDAFTYGALYQEYKKLADAEKKVIFGGRLGEYKYYDMDAVIASALSLAKRELLMM